MNLTQTYIEETYEELTPFDKGREHKTWLVRRRGTQNLYVRKEVEPEVYEIAKKRMHLKNEHLAAVVHVYMLSGKCFVVEEYVSGQTLQEIMERERMLSEAWAKDFAMQLLDALSDIHRLGIVHRDVTPSNIRVSQDHVIKLLDFGISRMREDGKPRDTRILGTAGYAAPEQFGFRQTDARTDIYAVGVILHQMLTGHLPGNGICRNRRLAGIIARATSLDPEDRYASAEEMRRALAKGRAFHWLPGFRSNTRWKKNLAIVIYVWCLFFLSVYVLDAFMNRHYYFREPFSAFLVFIASPLIFGNAGYWDRRVPGLRRCPRWLRAAVRIVVGIIILIIGMELYVGVVGTVYE